MALSVKLYQHLYLISEKGKCLWRTQTQGYCHDMLITKTIQQKHTQSQDCFDGSFTLLKLTLYTLKLFILTICKDKRPWACLLFSIQLLLMKYQVPPYYFHGRKTRFCRWVYECVRTLTGVTEVCCSERKQTFKYLLSNKKITRSFRIQGL